MPLTVGGGIRGFTDADGRHHSALDVAAEYFRSGADKVSIGGDAVEAALEFLASGVKTGKTAIEQISWVWKSPRCMHCHCPSPPGAPLHTGVRPPRGCPVCNATFAIVRLVLLRRSWCFDMVWPSPSTASLGMCVPSSQSRKFCGMQAYGAQAVVVSIDPRRVYVKDPADTARPTVHTARPGPAGERYCW